MLGKTIGKTMFLQEEQQTPNEISKLLEVCNRETHEMVLQIQEMMNNMNYFGHMRTRKRISSFPMTDSFVYMQGTRYICLPNEILMKLVVYEREAHEMLLQIQELMNKVRDMRIRKSYFGWLFIELEMEEKRKLKEQNEILMTLKVCNRETHEMVLQIQEMMNNMSNWKYVHLPQMSDFEDIWTRKRWDDPFVYWRGTGLWDDPCVHWRGTGWWFDIWIDILQEDDLPKTVRESTYGHKCDLGIRQYISVSPELYEPLWIKKERRTKLDEILGKMLKTEGKSSDTVDSLKEYQPLSPKEAMSRKKMNIKHHGMLPMSVQTARYGAVQGDAQKERGKLVENPELSDDAEKEIQEMDELLRCKVCFDNDACIVFLPCRHMATCEYCEGFLSHCPVCRSFIEEAVKINEE